MVTTMRRCALALSTILLTVGACTAEGVAREVVLDVTVEALACPTELVNDDCIMVPIPDATVEVLQNGAPQWTGKTDRTGFAESHLPVTGKFAVIVSSPFLKEELKLDSVALPHFGNLASLSLGPPYVYILAPKSSGEDDH